MYQQPLIGTYISTNKRLLVHIYVPIASYWYIVYVPIAIYWYIYMYQQPLIGTYICTNSLLLVHIYVPIATSIAKTYRQIQDKIMYVLSMFRFKRRPDPNPSHYTKLRKPTTLLLQFSEIRYVVYINCSGVVITDVLLRDF